MIQKAVNFQSANDEGEVLCKENAEINSENQFNVLPTVDPIGILPPLGEKPISRVLCKCEGEESSIFRNNQTLG